MKTILLEFFLAIICMMAFYSSLLLKTTGVDQNLMLCLILHSLNSWGVYHLSKKVMDMQDEEYWALLAAFFFALNPIAIETIYRDPQWITFITVFISLLFCILLCEKFKRTWLLFLLINLLPIFRNKFFIPQIGFLEYASADKFLVNLLDPFGFISPLRIDYKYVETTVDFFQFSSMLATYGLCLYYAYKNKNFVGSLAGYTVFALTILCVVYFFPSNYFYRNFYSAQIILAISFSSFCFFIISYLDKRSFVSNVLIIVLFAKGAYEIRRWDGIELSLMSADVKMKDQSQYLRKFETFYKKKMFAEALDQYRYLDLKNTIKFDTMMKYLEINLGLGDIDGVQNVTIAMIDHFPKQFAPHVFYYLDKLAEYGRPEIAVLYMNNVHKSMAIPFDEYNSNLLSYKVKLKDKKTILIKNLARFYKDQGRLDDMELALKYAKSVDL